MNNILVIGYGNTLRGDDGAGVYAAELIAKQFPEVKCIPVHQLTPELAEHMSQAEAVIFIDAQVGIQEITKYSIGVNKESNQSRTHFFSPETLLHLCQQLYNHTPRQTLCIGIPVQNLTFSEKLSEYTIENVNACIKMVETLIKS